MVRQIRRKEGKGHFIIISSMGVRGSSEVGGTWWIIDFFTVFMYLGRFDLFLGFGKFTSWTGLSCSPSSDGPEKDIILVKDKDSLKWNPRRRISLVQMGKSTVRNKVGGGGATWMLPHPPPVPAALPISVFTPFALAYFGGRSFEWNL